LISENLVFLAGKAAFSKIRDGGLHPDMVKVVTGAAGGPKGLVLHHLDRVLFSSWFGNRSHPLFLLGSSIGAWRFAAVSQKDPLTATERFKNAYLDQSYSSSPTSEEVTSEMVRGLNGFLDEGGIREILNHPFLRLSIMAVRSGKLAATDRKLPLLLALTGLVMANGLHRSLLKFFFERALFHDPRNAPPFLEMEGFPIRKTPLTPRNVISALLASGSIPLVMTGVNDIPGAPDGVYRDGGVIDYHMDIPFMSENDSGIVLFPHYVNRVIPGWLDKRLSWRKPTPSNMSHVLLVAPSDAFVRSLPHHKIPDRTDFRTFLGRDRERVAYWQAVVDRGEGLAAEFMEVVQSGRIREQVRLMPGCE